MKMKRKIVIISLAVVVLVISGFVWYRLSNKSVYQTIAVSRGKIAEEVLVTGVTKPVQSVDLSFERLGKVSRVWVSVGDYVKAGQILVEVRSGDLLAQLSQAQASLAAAESRLRDLQAGIRPEELAVEQTKVRSAESALEDAKNRVRETLDDAYSKADDAVRAKTDLLFTNPRSGNPLLVFNSSDQQLINDTQTQKVSIEKLLVSWKSALDAINGSTDIAAAGVTGEANLAKVKTYIDKVVSTLNAASVNGSVTQANIDAWKISVSASRAGIGTAISSLNSVNSGLRTAKINLDLVSSQLALKVAGNTPEQIIEQQAMVARERANVQSAQNELSKTALRSPIDGVVTKQDAKLGQIVTVTTNAVANSALISVVSFNKLEIECNVPEVEIGRLKTLQTVAITFDALPGEKFSGTVGKVDPAESIIDGVVYYKVTIFFESKDPRIKSGLTANLNIQTALKESALLLPQYAILEKDQGSYVRVVSGQVTRDDKVVVGIRSGDGNVEIISGVSEGDKVVNIGIKNQP